MNYIVKTQATMKKYNNKKWWIDSDIIPEKRISANSVEEALKIYRERVIDENNIDISQNAINNKSKMFVDTPDGAKQIGYIITGRTEFDKGDYTGYSIQYIDLWVTILTSIDTVF